MRRLLTLLVSACVLVSVPGIALAADVLDVTPAELAAVTDGLDGTTVRFSGEVVSEALDADDTHVWLNVLGDGVAMGVYLSADLAAEVTTFGDYRNDGDVVQVVGVYNEACDEHGGDMDVHATSLTVVSSGASREVEVQPWKGVVGVIGLAFAFVLSRRFRRMRDEVIA